MNYKLKPLSIAVLGGILTLTGCTQTTVTQSETGTIELRIVETTDIHANVMSFDYYKGKESSKIGLARAATLVKQVRSDATNSVLVDNGDLIQGSPMGDYIADRGMTKSDVHPAYKAMNQLNYEVGNFGNHEFNYGLEFLAETINDANFPYINANVFDEKTGEHYFTPYLIKTYQLKDTDGNEHDVKIGYIGFVPPQIKIWDKKNLEGKVVVKDILETAKLLVPEMKAKGADIIVAIPHSGISSDPHKAGAENSVYYLSQVKGIDAITFGHAHAVFPSKTFSDLKGVDLEKGTINGTPAVMPGRWGSHIGVIDLTLKYADGEWSPVSVQSDALPIYDTTNKKSLAQPDQGIVAALKEDHQHTLDFVNQPIGKADDVMYSFLSLVQDDPTVQIVNNAQRDYVEQFIQGDPDLDGIAVLSAAAPFKAGGRKNDPGNFTEVEAGQLTFKNAADLYLYPNTLVAMKVTGEEVKEWLECSAGQFNQVDTKNTKPQFLINWDEFRTYNFDTLDGVNYQIDVTQPAKYDGNCKVINPDAHRIVNLTYKGKAIDIKQPFLIATNNYRAYSAKFAGTGEDFIAFASPDENRSILSAYISKISKKDGMVKVEADNNWSFAPIKNAKKLDIRFETSPTKKAAKFIKDKAQYPMTFVENDEVGFAVYKIDLSK